MLSKNAGIRTLVRHFHVLSRYQHDIWQSSVLRHAPLSSMRNKDERSGFKKKKTCKVNVVPDGLHRFTVAHVANVFMDVFCREEGICPTTVAFSDSHCKVELFICSLVVVLLVIGFQT